MAIWYIGGRLLKRSPISEVAEVLPIGILRVVDSIRDRPVLGRSASTARSACTTSRPATAGGAGSSSAESSPGPSSKAIVADYRQKAEKIGYIPMIGWF